VTDDDRDTVVDKRTRLGVGDERRATPLKSLVGEIVAGYLVEAELGAGAMGAVYRASHVDANRVVAIKALHPEHMHEPRLVERFRREAMAAARLAHPNIAGIIDLGVSIADGRHLMILEYADGEPLSDIMTMPLPAERAIDLTGQILRGLEHAHGAGLVHRDLKPDNVMVAWTGEGEHVRIVDFGIAVLRTDDTLERLTATGQMIGTPIYMSPEQARCDPFDHRTDLFALGIIVYEMLTGLLPFTGRPLDIAIANINRDPPPFAERAPKVTVDPLLERFTRKLMARSLASRFASAREALDVLELFASDRAAAGLALGVMDVDRALATIALPQP
jgi:serine/threonine-protein kinase